MNSTRLRCGTARKSQHKNSTETLRSKGSCLRFHPPLLFVDETLNSIPRRYLVNSGWISPCFRHDKSAIPRSVLIRGIGQDRDELGFDSRYSDLPLQQNQNLERLVYEQKICSNITPYALSSRRPSQGRRSKRGSRFVSSKYRHRIAIRLTIKVCGPTTQSEHRPPKRRLITLNDRSHSLHSKSRNLHPLDGMDPEHMSHPIQLTPTLQFPVPTR